jgi:WD40 repeat protein
LALWRVPDPDDSSLGTTNKGNISSFVTSSSPGMSRSSVEDLLIPSYSYMNAVSVKQCKSAQKVRDIVFNRKLQEVACVSLNGYIHVWSADKFVQVC